MQAFVNHLEELVKEWKLHIKALDEYIKSLSKLPWKKLWVIQHACSQ